MRRCPGAEEAGPWKGSTRWRLIVEGLETLMKTLPRGRNDVLGRLQNAWHIAVRQLEEEQAIDRKREEWAEQPLHFRESD
jgi:hypothetical protein